MATNEQIKMVISLEQQQRLIEIDVNDDLNAIEKKINMIYQLQPNYLRRYQPQYYDSDYQRFIDLYPDSFEAFQKLLKKLSSPEAPSKSAKEWTLGVVPKNVQSTRHTIPDSITADDTYNYQQENDPSGLDEIKESTTMALQSSSPSDTSSINNSKAPPRDPLAQNTDNDEHVTVQAKSQLSRSGAAAANPAIVITSDHPCGLRLQGDLAEHQRLQYEKDMCRGNSTKGGVRLRACSQLGATPSGDKSYPVIHFQIPSDKQAQEWCLILCILTEAGNDGVHYIHSSKGIYSGETPRDHRCVNIRDSTSVNPFVFRLTVDQVRDGAAEIIIKVCNMRDISTRKKEQLKVFSRTANLQNYNQLTFLSTNTMHGLKFTGEKYHLGCTLICDEVIHDQCISNLTTAVPHQKRGDNDVSNSQEDLSSIIACNQNSQCPSTTHFCNTQKRSLTSACQNDYECLSNTCSDDLCRQPCKQDKDCSQTKEYCTTSNYCKAKHCGRCIRHIQCANNRCQLFNCASDSCAKALKKLQQY